MIGSFGTFSAFSFYPTKNLGGYGDGGAIVTNDEDLANKCRMLRNYGQKTRYQHDIQGLNSRLDELQAAILSVKLEKLSEWNSRRNKIAQLYSALLQGVGDIVLPKFRENAQSVHHLYVIKTQFRYDLFEYLRTKNIETQIHYPIPIHKQPCYEQFNSQSFPVCESISQQILSLPINPFLSDQEVEQVASEIIAYFNKSMTV